MRTFWLKSENGQGEEAGGGKWRKSGANKNIMNHSLPNYFLFAGQNFIYKTKNGKGQKVKK
jgi:hypothetical protein